MKIQIDECTMNYLEGIHFEVNGYKELLSNIILQKTKYPVNKEMYDRFMEDYLKVTQKYEATKFAIIESYVPVEYKTQDYSVNFNFMSLEIEIVKNNKGCGCNVQN